jgi:hypothetical protein
MISNAVLNWMAHLGQGTWAGFKRAVAAMASPEADVALEAQRLRMRFSDLAFAEFFVDGTDRWRSFAPMLVWSSHQPNEAFLCGARSSRLVESLRTAAQVKGCKFFELVVDGSFTTVKLHGDRRQVAAVAAAGGIPFESNISRRLANELVSLDEIVRTAPRRAPPRGWSVRTFDFSSMRWRTGHASGTVNEYTSRYEERSYFLEAGGEAIEMPKREAIFAAASTHSARVLKYDAELKELSGPMTAPLPESYARAACVTAGRASILRGDRIVYERIPAQLAGILMVGLGQLPPRFQFCEDQRGRHSP